MVTCLILALPQCTVYIIYTRLLCDPNSIVLTFKIFLLFTIASYNNTTYSYIGPLIPYNIQPIK